MAKYRNRETGEIKSKAAAQKSVIIELGRSINFSKVVDSLPEFGYDLVTDTSKPLPSSKMKRIHLDGAILSGSSWVQNWVELDIYSNDADGIANAKRVFSSEVSAKASTVRDGGTTIAGLGLATNAAARSLLAGAKVGGKANRKVVTRTGRANLSKVDFDALVAGVDDFIQAVFDNEYDLLEAIDAATTLAEIEAIDITVGWP
jgi:hypothetical protein